MATSTHYSFKTSPALYDRSVAVAGEVLVMPRQLLTDGHLPVVVRASSPAGQAIERRLLP